MGRLLEEWKHADPDLQPRVEDIRRRITAPPCADTGGKVAAAELSSEGAAADLSSEGAQRPKGPLDWASVGEREGARTVLPLATRKYCIQTARHTSWLAPGSTVGRSGTISLRADRAEDIIIVVTVEHQRSTSPSEDRLKLVRVSSTASRDGRRSP